MNTPILILLGILTIIFIWLWYTIYSQKSRGTDRTVVIPSTSSQGIKKKCISTRTPCDKYDPNSCNNSCDEQNLICVDLSTVGDSSGGSVCLPTEPDTSCNIQNGGVNVWTGYGFTETQGWSCLCQHPEIYNGEHCTNLNPSFCSGGSLDSTKSFTDPNFCTCPSGTKKLKRVMGNTPFCASTVPNSGELYGLAGNMKGTWEDIYTNINGANNLYNDWSANIASLLFGLNYTDKNKSDIQNILLGVDSTGKLGYLTPDIANKFCAMSGVSNKFCSQSGGTVNFPIGFTPVVSYTYYDNSF